MSPFIISGGIQTSNTDWIDLTDTGATTLHTHGAAASGDDILALAYSIAF